MKTATLTAFLLLLGLLDPKIKAKGKKYFGSAADPGTIGVAIDVTILTSDYGAYTPENRSVCCLLWGFTGRLLTGGAV